MAGDGLLSQKPNPMDSSFFSTAKDLLASGQDVEAVAKQLGLPSEFVVGLVPQETAPFHGPFISREIARSNGLELYATKHRCPHGHHAPRRVSNGQCVVCYSYQGRKRLTDEQRREYSKMAGRRYRQSAAGKAKIKERQTSDYWKHVYQLRLADPHQHAKAKIGGLIRSALKARGCRKSKRTEELLGITIPEMLAYIEAQFQPGMTWDNWTTDGWHLDHIRPVASFDDPQDPACWHYTNLQPLWAADNLAKSDTWEPVAA